MDLAAFGLGAEELASLASLGTTWHLALEQILAEGPEHRAVAEFAGVSVDLVTAVGDPAWQQRWLSAWHRLHGQGFSLADTLNFFFRVVEACERRIFGETARIGPLHLELLSILRRSVFAAVNSAIELGEEAKSVESGIPGEVAALQCLRRLLESGEPVAVLSLVLVNRNHFGHLAASDLQSLPGLLLERLRRLLQAQDMIFLGREGEWLLLLPRIRSMVQPALVATHIQRAFANPVGLLSGGSLPFDVLIGAAMLPDDGLDPETIVHAARLARWRLLPGSECFGWFHADMRADWQRRFEMAEELRQALYGEALELFLQPQVDATSGVCTSAELLLRWQRASGEWAAPTTMIEMIGENGWRPQFTDWLIRSALQAASELSAAGIDIPLSINLTAADLLDADLPEMLSQRLATWQLPGSRFTIELTESALLADSTRCLGIMRQLRALGFRLALDDFGTGYSSLSYLVSLPVDEIKIDRSFIVAMLNSQEHLRVVRTIIDLAWDLEMMPLAEGVEDPAQVEQLRQLGCHRMQGFLYAEAMPLTAFVTWFRNRP